METLTSSPVIEAGVAPAATDDPGLLELQDDIVRAFPEYKLASYFRQKPGAIAGADHVVVGRDPMDGRLLGLVVARGRSGYLHVEMNLIAADRQRTGALISLWRVMLERLVTEPEGFPSLVAIKTYNPMVYSSLQLVARLCGAELYPSLTAVAGDLTAVASRVAAELAPQCPFDPAAGVIRGASVPLDFYSSMPTTRKREVQAYFTRHVHAGDRMLCLVRFGPDADLARLLRRWNVARSTEGSPAHA